MYYALQTVSRKLQRSLTQRGIGATVKRLIAKPFEVLEARLWDLSPRYRECRREEAEFDRQRNIETAVHLDAGWMAKINSVNWMHGIGYAPVPVRGARSILAGLGICYEDYVFIDYGAGKGRMLFLAADFPFRRIIGVEYSPDLYQTLQHNLSTYTSPTTHCTAIEGVLQDAAQYIPPTDPLVLFFHHPFEAPVFRQVMDRIEGSLDESPRDILAIYYDPACRELFDQSSYFGPLRQGGRDPSERYSSNWIVYRSRKGTELSEFNRSVDGHAVCPHAISAD